MDFALSDEQTAIFDMAHAFGQDNIAPHSRQWEKDGTIPKFGVPDRIILIDALPKTSVGKLNKKEMRQQYK